MSDKSQGIISFVLLGIFGLIAINIDRILYKASRYWDRHIAPTIEAIFKLLFWLGGIALAIFITWRVADMIYQYVKERMIILRGEYVALLNDITELRNALNKSEGKAAHFENQAWRLSQEVEALTLKLKKATAKPEAVTDNLVNDILGGA